MINLSKSSLLKAKAPQGLRASRSRIARSVAILVSLYMGIGLFIGIQPLEDASRNLDPKIYIRSIYSKEKALCLIKLYGKESAFNVYAIGNRLGKKQAFGIPQLKNPLVAHMSAIEQVNAGIEYIKHRYKGDTCLAYAHYIKKGWH